MLAILANCFALSIAEAGNNREPTIWDQFPNNARQVAFDFARGCQVEGHQFTLEKTTLSELVAALGRGKIMGNHRDAAGCETFVDFTNGSNRLRFSSNCEMGGGDLDEIEVMPAPDEELQKLPHLRTPLMFLFGRIGMPVSHLARQLGAGYEASGKIFYAHQERATEDRGQPADFKAYSTLEVAIRGGRVSAIRLIRITTD